MSLGIKDRNGFGQFIGTSLAMQDIYSKIEKVAATKTNILVTGESGTGKEVCAEALHFYSDYNQGPFITINCAALPSNLIDSMLFGHVRGAFTGAENNRDGAIRSANDGTLFLDEIGDMPMEVQSKLLRFVENFTAQPLGSDKNYQANVRIVCATNKNLKQAIDEGCFRADLFHRLNNFSIHMPDLSMRSNDILDLAEFYIEQYAREMRREAPIISETASHYLKMYSWPGNIRELQNIIRQILLNEGCSVITANMLPDSLRKVQSDNKNTNLSNFTPIHMPLKQIERNAIEQAISHCNGNIPKAATLLDVAPSTLYRKIAAWKNDREI